MTIADYKMNVLYNIMNGLIYQYIKKDENIC